MHHQINYIEIPVQDLSACKAFFRDAFEWDFVDYGPDYASFNGAGIDGGIYKSDKSVQVESGSVLVVLYSNNLELSLERVVQCGAKIVKEIFSFPGGRRFHFCGPVGNEFAIWSDK